LGRPSSKSSPSQRKLSYRPLYASQSSSHDRKRYPSLSPKNGGWSNHRQRPNNTHIFATNSGWNEERFDVSPKNASRSFITATPDAWRHKRQSNEYQIRFEHNESGEEGKPQLK
jgi:hypothetical protein